MHICIYIYIDICIYVYIHVCLPIDIQVLLYREAIQSFFYTGGARRALAPRRAFSRARAG